MDTPASTIRSARAWLVFRYALGALLLLVTCLAAYGAGFRWYARVSPKPNRVTGMTVSGPVVAPSGIVAEPALVDFGECAQGQKAVATVRIMNRTNKPLIVSRTTTSCRCLTLEPNTQRLEPGEQAAAELRLDLAHEPRFVGGMVMTLSVFNDDGEKALTLHAKVRVK